MPREAACNNKSKGDRNYNVKKEEEYEDNALLRRGPKVTSLAFHADQSGEKHHHQNRNQKKKGKKNEYQYHYDRYGRHTQHGQAQQQPNPSASKPRRRDDPGHAAYDVIRGSNATITSHESDENDDTRQTITSASSPSHRAVKRKKDYKRVGTSYDDHMFESDIMQSGKMRSDDHSGSHFGRSEPILPPKGRAGSCSASVAERKKHPRLQGADLYVTRVGWQGKPERKPKRKITAFTSETTVSNASSTPVEALTESLLSFASLSTASSHSASGSLHDELIDRTPTRSPCDSSAEETCGFERSNVHASRPCYRCMTFMHSVGIRRVFWTNDSGEWEGGKVARLVEGMKMGMNEVASLPNSDGGPMGNGVFVTKHEVLMLRRIMGAKGMS